MVTLQFIPYTEIAPLSSLGRIRKLLNVAKQDRIVLLQGRLHADEEAELIKATMEEINREFRGIELAVINPATAKNISGVQKFRENMFSMLLGNRSGMTIIGPANVVKSIKKDPNKIELFMAGSRQLRSRKK